MAINAAEVAAHEDLCEAIHESAERGETTFNFTNNYDLRDFPQEVRLLKPTVEILHVNNCFQLRSMPRSTGDLTNLRWLNVSYNQLTELPPEVGKLRHLERLHCNNNQITSLPLEIWGLKELEELHCDTNQIKALPTGVLLMRKLRELQVENNPLLAPSDVEGAEASELVPEVRGGDCSNCCIRFQRAIPFVSFHNVAGNLGVPFAHYVCSTRCENQLRERLSTYDRDQRAAEEAASPSKRLLEVEDRLASSPQRVAQ